MATRRSPSACRGGIFGTFSEPKVRGWAQVLLKIWPPGSPLASSFPPERRRCHPSLGPRQRHNSTVWALATDTITWAADKTHLPGPRRAEPLLTHNSLVRCHACRWPWIKRKVQCEASTLCMLCLLLCFQGVLVFASTSFPYRTTLPSS